MPKPTEGHAGGCDLLAARIRRAMETVPGANRPGNLRMVRILTACALKTRKGLAK